VYHGTCLTPRPFSECERGRLLAAGACVAACPDNFYPDQERAACLPCHYTCAACRGPNDYQCAGCHGDATLTTNALGAACLNTELLARAHATDRWYSGVLVAVLLLAAALLVVCVAFWRQRSARAGAGYRALPVGYHPAADYKDELGGPRVKASRPDVTVVRAPLRAGDALPQTEIELPSDEYYASSDPGEESDVLLDTK